MATHITRVHIEGFRRFDSFDLELNPTFNVLVGDNETGKSSILEALSIVLSRQYKGRTLHYSLDPYLFNTTMVRDYFTRLRDGKNDSPPKLLIEVYLHEDSDDPDLAKLKGRNNTKNEDCPGLKLAIEVDAADVDALEDYARDDSNPAVLPVEFYRTTWRSFADNPITIRNLPFRAKTIDTSLPRASRGPNRYVAQLVDDVLTEEQRRDLSLAYKALCYGFEQQPGVQAINEHLENQGTSATNKKLTVQVDMSPRSTWDSTITAYLNDLPFDCAGKGQQCHIQMHLAIADAEKSRVLLIEEPENHLSYANLTILLETIGSHCADRQVIVATHSAFVLNKLGLDTLRFLSRQGQTMMLADVTAGTKDYFMKLPGYDTLRMILSRRCILVEGPSDELIVQRAYKDKYGKLPLEDGVDVISVRSLAFKRFLEIATLLKLDVRVVTDNDGSVAALKSKYSDYMNGRSATIRICYDSDETHETLEAQLLKANSLKSLNTILETDHADHDALLTHMSKNKTACALQMFNTKQTWNTPDYIADAIK